jgi:hypothetical protein
MGKLLQDNMSVIGKFLKDDMSGCYSYCHLLYGQVITRYYELVYSISSGILSMGKLLQAGIWLLPHAAWASYCNML